MESEGTPGCPIWWSGESFCRITVYCLEQGAQFLELFHFKFELIARHFVFWYQYWLSRFKDGGQSDNAQADEGSA